MPAVSKRTEKILRKVQALILKDANSLQMDMWGHSYPACKTTCDVTLSKSITGDKLTVKQKLPPCGTTACIAGHVLLNSTAGRQFLKDTDSYRKKDGRLHVYFPMDTDDIAQGILGITETQAERLFLLPFMNGERPSWPEKFAQRYAKAKTAKTRAKIAADRIEHFIQTGE